MRINIKATRTAAFELHRVRKFICSLSGRHEFISFIVPISKLI